MSLTAPLGGDFEVVPAGNYIGRCIKVIDLGTQHSEFYGNWVHKVRIIFELPTVKMKDGKCFGALKDLTLSMNKKANLRKILESWRGKTFTDSEAQAFDILSLIDAPGLINIIHNEQGYANISSITPIPQGTTCLPRENETVSFVFDPWDENKFLDLPEKTREKIKKSKEWKDKNGVAVNVSEDDDVPF